MTSWAMCGNGHRPHTKLLARTCVSCGGHRGSTLLMALPITGLGSPPGKVPGTTSLCSRGPELGQELFLHPIPSFHHKPFLTKVFLYPVYTPLSLPAESAPTQSCKRSRLVLLSVGRKHGSPKQPGDPFLRLSSTKGTEGGLATSCCRLPSQAEEGGVAHQSVTARRSELRDSSSCWMQRGYFLESLCQGGAEAAHMVVSGSAPRPPIVDFWSLGVSVSLSVDLIWWALARTPQALQFQIIGLEDGEAPAHQNRL